MSYRKDEVYIEIDYENTEKLTIMLPHSCDQWVIGSPDEARQLIADIQKLIPELEQKLSTAPTEKTEG